MNADELKVRTGYAGKSQQWQYGFDLACREKQAEIDALKAQNAELLAALDVASEDFWGIGYSYEAQKADQAIAKARGESCK